MAAPKPFSIHVPDMVLRRIRERVLGFRWEAMPDAGGWNCGTDLRFMRELADYWTTSYDWRRQESELNRYPQYVADIDGLKVHFYHVKGARADAIPIILLHGWPGSAFEFLHLVDELTQPAAVGDASPVFDVVIPCLPGFGFSDAPACPIGPRSMAGMFNRLMVDVLGYDAYITQGGDWGSSISSWLGFEHTDHCRAVHLNMLFTQSTTVMPTSAEEVAWSHRMQTTVQRESAYGMLQATKPQSLSYAMHDSPIGVAAWILEKFAAWSDLALRPDGSPDLSSAYSFDQLLTNLMFYVATDRFATAAWIYHGLLGVEGSLRFPAGARCETPTAIAAFPDPVFPPAPRSLSERSYNLVRWTAMPRGGHFAALEQPQLLLEDVRAFARSVENCVAR